MNGPVRVEGQARTGGFVVLCDHASNAVPERLAGLGLTPQALDAHVAWDRGALELSRELAQALDAPLAWPAASRLVVDCNRAPDRPDLIVEATEFGPVPGNRDVTGEERARRIAEVHAPYHAAVAALVERQAAPTLIAVHSFTPVLHGRMRPWHVGVLHDRDRELAAAVVGRLRADPGLSAELNVPYAPADGVYYTLDRHAQSRGLPSLMLEVRDDLLEHPAGRQAMAARLAAAIAAAATVPASAGAH